MSSAPSAYLLQDHEHYFGLHRVHAAADGLHAQLAEGKGQEHNKAARELGRLGALLLLKVEGWGKGQKK